MKNFGAPVSPARRGALLLAGVAVFAGAFWRVGAKPETGGFAVSPPITAAVGPARYESRNLSHDTVPFAHSVAAVEVPGRGLVAFWYGGTREGSKDSAIYSAVFDSTLGAWGSESQVISRPELERALHRSIRKIGNPVAWRGRDNRLWLFFVSASIGGWSGSAVNVMQSADGGHSWSAPERLITSPFLNVSTLVKGPAFEFADGSIGLPVYHELVGKFGELLRIDGAGRVSAKQRLAWGQYSLQPVIVPRSGDDASGFMRYSGEAPGRVLFFHSGDGGRNWSAPEKLELPNPNAAVAAVRAPDGGLLLAFNNQEGNRDNLSLAHSADGRHWRVIHVVEDTRGRTADGRSGEFSYPWLMQTDDGNFHLMYTVDKQRIRHVLFSGGWLRERLR